MTRVYKYGTVPGRIAAPAGETEAHEQLRIAGRLWNLLVAIERARIARYRRIMHDAGQERIDALRSELAAARQAIRDARKAARRRAAPDSGADTVQRLRAELGAAIQAQRATSAERHEARRGELAALAEATKRRIKRARQAAASCGLFWGTYNDIVGRADAGRKAGELQFRRFGGDGTLTAQIIGGAAVAECFAGRHTFFHVEGLAAGRKWQWAKMRIGSNADRGPVWLQIPIVVDRPIPDAAVIKSVSMTRRSGRWSLNVTVTVPDPAPKPAGAAIALDIGWRLLSGGAVRVAWWRDTAGRTGQVTVSAGDLSQIERVCSLRSICDRMRDDFLPVLGAWLDGRELAADWKQQTAALTQWRSADRVARLIRWWGDNRLAGDGEIFTAAVGWRRQYLHLANWWRNLEQQMRLRLREQYRVFAAGVAREYAAVYVEQFDLSKVAERPAPESADVATGAGRIRQAVSPSGFRAALRNAALREGLAFVELPASYTTRTCNGCGQIDEWNQSAKLAHTCSACGARWDQDENAAANLLRAGLASGAAAPADVRVRKWDRVRDRSQKRAESAANQAAMG